LTEKSIPAIQYRVLAPPVSGARTRAKAHDERRSSPDASRLSADSHAAREQTTSGILASLSRSRTDRRMHTKALQIGARISSASGEALLGRLRDRAQRQREFVLRARRACSLEVGIEASE